MLQSKRNQRKIRHRRVRSKITGTLAIPRASVFRSNKHIFVQLVDDSSGKILVSNAAKSDTLDTTKKTKTETAEQTGIMIAELAKKAGIEKIVFDRGGYQYHGRVKALAEGLRKGGLKF